MAERKVRILWSDSTGNMQNLITAFIRGQGRSAKLVNVSITTSEGILIAAVTYEVEV